MLFNSYLFIFCFLPLVWIGFHILRYKNHIKSAKIFLISASLFFYGYWKWLYLPLLLSSMIINYFIATAILKHNSTLLINAKNMRGGGAKVKYTLL